MKITADMNQVVPGKWNSLRRYQNTESLNSQNQARAGNESPSTIGARSSSGMRYSERRVAEALTLAQMAQNIISKAMEISSRLKNIAIDAMTSNRINTEELNSVNAEIRSAFNNYTDRFNVIIIPPDIQKSGTDSNLEKSPPSKINLEIRPALDALKESALKLSSGELQNVSRLDLLSDNLKQKSAAVQDAIEKIVLAGSSLAEHSYPSSAIGDIRELVSSTKSDIVNDQKKAILAQGNISHANLVLLIQ